MVSYSDLLVIMPDGTIKQTNPLTGRRSWFVPGRGKRPLALASDEPPKRLKGGIEDYCDFCEANYLKTPPEKERVLCHGDQYAILERVPARRLRETSPLFRRVVNLYEIVTFDYWEKNHGHGLTPSVREWKGEYMSTPEGREHVLNLVNNRLSRIYEGDPEALHRMSEAERAKIADAFFGGCHEVIIAKRHFIEGAELDDQKASSGDLSRDEHYHYFRLTARALEGIQKENPHVRYVIVFQNWLRPAGASFDHLHKQLVALDEWGDVITKMMEGWGEDRNIFNEAVVNLAARTGRIIMESDQAVALADIGHEYPTVAVYSKGESLRPQDHSVEEMRGVSDMVRAVHMAAGREVPSNEEWHYTPVGAEGRIPWHILIKWRVSASAGFEGGTGISINPISPFEIREMLIGRLRYLREKGAIGDLRIGEECSLEPDPLRYNG